MKRIKEQTAGYLFSNEQIPEHLWQKNSMNHLFNSLLFLSAQASMRSKLIIMTISFSGTAPSARTK